MEVVNPLESVGTGFKCIVADPPWQLSIGRQRTANGPVKTAWKEPRYSERYALKYPTMTIGEIESLPVSAVAGGVAHLYLWTINAHVEAAYRVARAWGFRPASLLTWAKSPMGLGLGGTFCNTTEFCLFARRGTLPANKRIETTWWHWKRGRHSAKPEAFQDMVETVSPGPYLELFARRPRPGWTVWGNEV